VADQGRLKCLADEMAAPFTSRVVMNCPRRLETLPSPTPVSELTQGQANRRGGIVLYCGSVGPGRGVLSGVRSMPWWPADSLFVLAGPCSEQFSIMIRAEAARVGAADRIVFLGALAPKELWSARKAADLALTIFEPYDLNSRFSAGASNKRFEAMAAGTPQVTDDNPGVPELIAANGCGLCVAPDNPELIGNSVATLLGDPARRSAMGQRARELHLAQFNYESEFAPVLEQISTWLKH